jgi:coenzyme F420 hydrogenase subunit beta
MCTDCGVSRTSQPKRCASACQFVKPDYQRLERQVHGRARDLARTDEKYFGPFESMSRVKLRNPMAGAQWTGVTTRIAERLLESGEVQAVLTMTKDPADPWRPVPTLITDPRELADCRGMRMGYAPLLSLLEPALAQGITRLAVIGIPCQIYALRALQKELGFDKLLVIGIPCSDNTHTEKFEEFLSLLVPDPSKVTYLEFRADYRVELRFTDGTRRDIPFLALPLSRLPTDFFPLTCRTCVDYSNTLADVTVGYMAGEGDQWLVVRNAQGQAMIDLLGDELVCTPLRSRGRRAGAVSGFIKNVQRSAGGLPLRRMPQWIRPLVSWLMPRTGPRGLEFARARLEMKAAESVIHLRREKPRRVRSLIPAHVWELTTPYGLQPTQDETADAGRVRP